MTAEALEVQKESYRKIFPDHPNIDAELHDNVHVVLDPEDAVSDLMAATTPQPIKANCSNKYTAVHHSGKRNLEIISGQVWHCTQSSTAVGAASWFTNQDSLGSAHRCVDDVVCYRTLAPEYIPWAAPGMNTFMMHMEMAGFDSWSNHHWLHDHEATLKRACYKTAVDAKRFKYPIKWLTVNDMKSGERHGITDHWAVSHAFQLSSHHDPRNAYDTTEWGYPRDYMLDLTRWYHKHL